MSQKQNKPTNTELTSLNALKLANSEIPVKPSMTALQVRELGTPALSQLVKEKDREYAVNYVKGEIVKLTIYLGASWQDYQVSTAADDFYSHYFYWKMADLKRFMIGCRTMEYGQMYGAFQPSQLMEWAKAYDLAWLAVSEQISQGKANEKKDRRDKETSVKDFLKDIDNKPSKPIPE